MWLWIRSQTVGETQFKSVYRDVHTGLLIYSINLVYSLSVWWWKYLEDIIIVLCWHIGIFILYSCGLCPERRVLSILFRSQNSCKKEHFIRVNNSSFYACETVKDISYLGQSYISFQIIYKMINIKDVFKFPVLRARHFGRKQIAYLSRPYHVKVEHRIIS